MSAQHRQLVQKVYKLDLASSSAEYQFFVDYPVQKVKVCLQDNSGFKIALDATGFTEGRFVHSSAAEIELSDINNDVKEPFTLYIQPDANTKVASILVWRKL